MAPREEVIKAFNDLRKAQESVVCVVSVKANFFNDLKSHTTCRVSVVVDEDTEVADIANYVLEASKRAIQEMLEDIQEQTNGSGEEDEDGIDLTGEYS